MGDIADMMLDGTLCEGCGVAMDDVTDDDFDAPGYPRRCAACARAAQRYANRTPSPPPRADKTNCPTCRKRVKVAGLADHIRDVHGTAEKP